MSFCSKCGESVQINALYCRKCGSYLVERQKNVKNMEEPLKFCIKCGSQIKNRYCTNCGAFAMKTNMIGASTASAKNIITDTSQKVQGKMKNVKIDEVIPQKRLSMATGFVTKAKEQYKEWLKNAGIFAIFMLIFSLGFAFLTNAVIMPIIEDKLYSSYIPYTLIDATKKIVNPIVLFYSMLYGAKTKYMINVAETVNGSMYMILPYFLILFTIIFIILSDRIRQSITKAEKNVYNIVTMALANSVLTTLVLSLLQKKVSISGDDFSNFLDFLSMSDTYYFLQSVLYEYGVTDTVIVKSSVSNISVFSLSFIITLGVLILSTKMSFISNKYKEIKSLLRSLCFAIIITSFIPAVITSIRIISTNRLDWWNGIPLVIIFFGAFLTLMLTGRFAAVKYILGSKTTGEIELGLMKIMAKSYEEKESASNPFRFICITFMVLAIIIILYYAVKMWKSRQVSITDMLKESAVCSIIISMIFAFFAKTGYTV